MARLRHPDRAAPIRMSLCLASGTLMTKLAISAFTLSWMHSIEKIQWEEDWRIAGQLLVLDEARIRGSGAGMDPPDGARLEAGVWHYRVSRELSTLELAHSPYTPGYTLCIEASCRPLASYFRDLPATAAISLTPCD